MEQAVRVKSGTLRLIRGDLTDLDVESFVFYAQHNLKLGSGFGTAISVRGGPAVQEELDKIGSLGTTDVVVTNAGELKAKYILHAVGPRFREPDLEAKLEKTMLNVLKAAEEKGISQIAFPPMGSGFYGVPLDVCASVMTRVINEHLANGSGLRDVVICVMDNREAIPFEKAMTTTGQAS